jgi:protein-tyrosine phosphatase
LNNIQQRKIRLEQPRGENGHDPARAPAARRSRTFCFPLVRPTADISAMREVLFLCTGNYYRSRFAEAVFNHRARRDGLAWAAFSRGLAIHLVEGDLSPFTALALRMRGIASTHTGATRVALTEADLHRAHHVVALKREEHLAMMRAQFPAWADRITYWTVHDIDRALPTHALAEIEGLVTALLHDLTRTAEAPRPASQAG